ncbi:hypothetical protein ACFXG4_22755 [Nocardia sp. NPDC059246]|uniref:hypothetical protein n=1 Tax=unclassified Nocardia TaxID=2637762 RepID=UPI0036A49AF7
MSWKRQTLIAASCVAALVLSAGGWVIVQHDFGIRAERVNHHRGALNRCRAR